MESQTEARAVAARGGFTLQVTGCLKKEGVPKASYELSLVPREELWPTSPGFPMSLQGQNFLVPESELPASVELPRGPHGSPASPQAPLCNLSPHQPWS